MAQLSILDLMERKTAIALILPEEVIATVIRHKWKAAHDATALYRTVEDSGLGKFSVRTKKIIKRIGRLELMIERCKDLLNNEDLQERKRAKCIITIEGALEEIEYLKTKI